LFMLLDSAYLIALIVGMSLVQRRQHSRLDWHGQRGLSFLQLGLREIARLSYERLSLPKLGALPSKSPPKAYASQRNRLALEQRIEFNKVIRFSW
ncbi:MAG: IS4 family transposase, partial [Leptolyngbyaceae cyanobacterium]